MRSFCHVLFCVLRHHVSLCLDGITNVCIPLLRPSAISSLSTIDYNNDQPFPFPKIQMAKTVLVFWLFSLPFCICNDDDTTLVEKLVMIVLITVGFTGIESVSMELSDVFGDDENDLDNSGYAAVLYEDCYIAIYKVDGIDWAHHLKNRFVTYCEHSTDANMEIAYGAGGGGSSHLDADDDSTNDSGGGVVSGLWRAFTGSK